MGVVIRAEERFPSPGSYAARERGCVCPPIDNRHGRGYRPHVPGRSSPKWIYRWGCPVHQDRERSRSDYRGQL